MKLHKGKSRLNIGPFSAIRSVRMILQGPVRAPDVGQIMSQTTHPEMLRLHSERNKGKIGTHLRGRPVYWSINPEAQRTGWVDFYPEADRDYNIKIIYAPPLVEV